MESVQFGDEELGTFIWQGQRRAGLVCARANAVWVEAASAQVMKSEGGDLGVHQRISEMADPLHFGTFAGYWTRTPWFLFGLLMTGLAVSGAAIYSHRVAHSARRRGSLPYYIRNLAGNGPLTMDFCYTRHHGRGDDWLDVSQGLNCSNVGNSRLLTRKLPANSGRERNESS